MVKCLRRGTEEDIEYIRTRMLRLEVLYNYYMPPLLTPYCTYIEEDQRFMDEGNSLKENKNGHNIGTVTEIFIDDFA